MLPAHNAAGQIEESVHALLGALSGAVHGHEVLIAEDGSTDGTRELAERLAGVLPGVRHLHARKRRGRGGALVDAFRASRGDVFLYMDVDREISPTYVPALMASIDAGADVAVVSKRCAGARTEAPALRRLMSATYNGLVRLLLGSRCHCHQGGMKAFRRGVLERVLPMVEDRHWFWDTEVLVLAQRFGFRVVEVPVRLRYGFGSTSVRPLRDSLGMLVRLIRMRGRLRGLVRGGVLAGPGVER
ncbi:MAG: glycosyltransferase [Planctomycetes bacterium]|nr:glycosyltransferase [Planctomycetota bacterium]